MATINIHQAKTHLSRLVDEVKGGKQHIIAKAGKPLAKLVPIRGDKPVRQPGYLKGKIRIGAKFDAPLPAKVRALFEK